MWWTAQELLENGYRLIALKSFEVVEVNNKPWCKYIEPVHINAVGSLIKLANPWHILSKFEQ